MRFDRMDRVAISGMAVLAIVILFFVLRGDQVGVQVTRTAPASGAEGVGTRGLIAFTFSEPMSQTSVEQRLRIAPEVSGTLRWNGATAFWTSPQPLQADTTYTVTIASGATSARGRQLLDDATWSFRTGHPRLVYLAPFSAPASDLYVLDVLNNGAAQRLTNEPFGVRDYAISPDGRRIVYSVNRAEKDADRDLYLINSDGSGRELLIQCDGQVCQEVSWSADGTRIAFERRNMVQGAVGRSPGPGRIWLMDVETREVSPLFADSQQIGSLPRFAPVGDRLSYYDPQQNSINIVDTATGDQVQLPSLLGDSGTWSPDANQLIYPELQAFDAGQFSQLLRADLVTNIITAVTPISDTNDSSAVWSPIGDVVALGRQFAGGGRGILGPQLWLITPDGASARALTNEPEFNHGSYAWSPDGAWIAMQRVNLLQPYSTPELWLIKADGSERRKLVDDAILPAWLP
jgi:Tol biopolymer transport system component